ncbi:RanBP2-type zinc finger protein [Acorus calamus]|uniref:RanBP2-type zinc finger protein n=1 Tax=Acorus calamus TaxID=4465 RepID=A0AAV9FC38_ACOCL|nr:RanBP2-type zinc finger protein [Acorus calamus]
MYGVSIIQDEFGVSMRGSVGGGLGAKNVDNRNSSAAKRARTDGSRREDDWTCPSCGNVNFSFRTTCNMRNCTQPRPVDHNSKSTAKPLQAPPSYSPSAAYMNSGAPSSMYFGAPYGSSLFNGSSMPPYDFPFSGGSGYHYDYGSRLSVGSPYGPLHLSAPPPYSSGSMLGSGGMYGVPPMMDRYGLGFPMGQSTMGLRPGVFPDENSQKKSAGMSTFAARMIHMTKCNRQNCGADKPFESHKSPRLASEEDDQNTFEGQEGPELSSASQSMGV